jgi:hypothetical protein
MSSPLSSSTTLAVSPLSTTQIIPLNQSGSISSTSSPLNISRPNLTISTDNQSYSPSSSYNSNSTNTPPSHHPFDNHHSSKPTTTTPRPIFAIQDPFGNNSLFPNHSPPKINISSTSITSKTTLMITTTTATTTTTTTTTTAATTTTTSSSSTTTERQAK